MKENVFRNNTNKRMTKKGNKMIRNFLNREQLEQHK